MPTQERDSLIRNALILAISTFFLGMLVGAGTVLKISCQNPSTINQLK